MIVEQLNNHSTVNRKGDPMSIYEKNAPTCECEEHKEAAAGKIVGEHSKQDACCDGHDHSGHNHSH